MLVLSVSACSDGGEDGAAEASAALKACQEVFGAENVEAVRPALGGGELRAETVPLDQMKEALLKKARNWTPSSENFSRAWYQPCRLLEASENRVQSWVAGEVKWSVLTMDTVTTGKSASEWRKAGDDVYVQHLSRSNGIAVVLSCRIQGAVPEQERQLPLEIRVYDQALQGDRVEVLGRLASALATDTRERLGCEDPLSIPTVLKP
ncbi:hypothetical protein ACF05T_19315 [Streptomyces lateritius]|uniref:Lipoprotein n=1 Tax=Streptomyces lateritius TaxID=67313 RepID=A0ABW6YF59_9ACTN